RSTDSSVRSARTSISASTRLRTSGSNARASGSPNCRWATTSTTVVALLAAVGRRSLDQLAEVELLTELADQLEVGLEVIDMLLLDGEDVLEDVGSGDVALLPAHRDTGPQPFDDLHLHSQIGLQLLLDGLPDSQREQPLEVGEAL